MEKAETKKEFKPLPPSNNLFSQFSSNSQKKVALFEESASYEAQEDVPIVRDLRDLRNLKR